MEWKDGRKKLSSKGYKDGRIVMEKVQKLVLKLIHSLKKSFIERCGDNFVSLVVFGSFARGDFGLNSDIDLLLIFRQFLGSYSVRMQFFQEIEKDVEAEKMEIFESTGYYPHFSPILRTIDEARRFSRIYLDMTEHVLVIYDKNQFFMQILKDVRNFLGKIDAQKRWIGKKWYWVFSPDVEIGEVLPDG